MCGIAGGFGVNLGAMLDAIAHRGPDARGEITHDDGLSLGHLRLAIVDLDPRSNQPFHAGETTISYNGECWNHRQLRQVLEQRGRRFSTTGDTEVVAHALDHWDEDALARIHGMHAVAWHRDSSPGIVKLARDPYGEVPLHIGKPTAFASEIKALVATKATPRADVGPGHVATIDAQGQLRQRCYYWPNPPPFLGDRDEAITLLRQALEQAVAERAATADVPLSCLLSGGLDSSAILAILKKHAPDVVAFTATHDPRSPDLRAARRVADHLNVPLVEVPVPNPTPDDAADTVRTIEMPHKAQVEIAWPCSHLARAIHHHGFKVTFSGEGSDELWASYAFAFHGLKKIPWLQYRRSLFLQQARKNFPRANKAFMAHHVECRLPFLHIPLVELALSFPKNICAIGKNHKALLAQAVQDLIPPDVARRPKTAFQDALGIKPAFALAIHNPKKFYQAELTKFLRT